MNKNTFRLIISQIKYFFHNEEGASTLEFGLILGFSILCFTIIIGIGTKLFDWLSSLIDDLFNQI